MTPAQMQERLEANPAYVAALRQADADKIDEYGRAMTFAEFMAWMRLKTWVRP